MDHTADHGEPVQSAGTTIRHDYNGILRRIHTTHSKSMLSAAISGVFEMTNNFVDDAAWRARMEAEFAEKKARDADLEKATGASKVQAGLSWGLKVDTTKPAIEVAAASDNAQRISRTFRDPRAANEAGFTDKCSHPGCNQWFKSKDGLATHERLVHKRDASDVHAGLAGDGSYVPVAGRVIFLVYLVISQHH